VGVSTDKQGKSGLGLDAQHKTVEDYRNGGVSPLVGKFTGVCLRLTGWRCDKWALEQDGSVAMPRQASLQFRYMVISLEHQPERLVNFRARNDQTNVAIEHFKAIDGAKLTTVDPTILAKGALFYTPGAIGNAMSHLALWKECVSSDTNLVVFEDDARLRHDLSRQLHNICERCDWDLIIAT
jgi:hypothetical protein